MGSGPAFTVPAPRVALFSGAQQFFWNDAANTPFNGFCLIGRQYPTASGTAWTEVDYGNLYPSIFLPVFQRIPIVDGALNDSCGLFLSSDMTPPDTVYIAWYYDSTGRQIAGPTATFQVTSIGNTSFTPPILTLQAPTGPGVAPVPD